jgi:hypothetical protein
MAVQARNNKRRDQIQATILITLPLLLVAYGWFNVYNLATNLEDNTIETYQEAMFEVVDNAAYAAELYSSGEIQAIRDANVGASDEEIAAEVDSAIPDIENYMLQNFVGTIQIGNLDGGDGLAWIYSPERIILDNSGDVQQYPDQSAAQIFEAQDREAGAFHYEELVDGIMNAKSGVGWYVYDPEKAKDFAPWWEFVTDDTGIEVAAWKAFNVFGGEEYEKTWIIGMSAMLPELMTENGAYNDIQNAITQMVIITIAVLLLMVSLWRAETQVKELRDQVRELRVEIDEGKRAQQVSEIVDSEYFQGLAERAKELRERHKNR